MKKTEKILWEQNEKKRIRESSIKILNYVKENSPELYKLELAYQQYRNKFSEIYFKTSDWYRGDSIVKFIRNQPLSSADFTPIIEMIIFKNTLK